MIIISTRKDFVNDDKANHTYVIKEIETRVKRRDLNIPQHDIEDDEFISKITGDKVLIVVHGYNNKFKEIIKTFNGIEDELSSSYDHIIGFAWSAGDRFVDYYTAKNKVEDAGDELREILDMLKDSGKTVDVMAHSMGNAVVFDAFIENEIDSTVVRNFFSFAAAVDNDTLNKNNLYNVTLANFENIFICYSKKDSVTGVIYDTGERHNAPAFGHELPIDLEYFVDKAKNVHFINCNEVITKHGAYKKSEAIFSFVRETINPDTDNNYTFKTLK